MSAIYEASDVSSRIIYNLIPMAPDFVVPRNDFGKRNFRSQVLMTILKISITIVGLILVINGIDFQVVC